MTFGALRSSKEIYLLHTHPATPLSLALHPGLDCYSAVRKVLVIAKRQCNGCLLPVSFHIVFKRLTKNCKGKQ